MQQAGKARSQVVGVPGIGASGQEKSARAPPPGEVDWRLESHRLQERYQAVAAPTSHKQAQRLYCAQKLSVVCNTKYRRERRRGLWQSYSTLDEVKAPSATRPSRSCARPASWGRGRRLPDLLQVEEPAAAPDRQLHRVGAGLLGGQDAPPGVLRRVPRALRR